MYALCVHSGLLASSVGLCATGAHTYVQDGGHHIHVQGCAGHSVSLWALLCMVHGEVGFNMSHTFCCRELIWIQHRKTMWLVLRHCLSKDCRQSGCPGLCMTLVDVAGTSEVHSRIGQVLQVMGASGRTDLRACCY